MRQSLVATTLALGSVFVAGPCLSAADADASPTGELRILLGMEPGYEVSEEAKAVDGSTTSYEWEGLDKDAGAVAVQYVTEFGNLSQVLGQPIIGFEVLCSSAVLKPTGYTVDGGTYSNDNDEEFNYFAVTPTAVVGWRFAKPETSEVGAIGELQLLAGGTVVRGEVSDNSGASDTSLGFGFDVGARIVFGIKEGGWTGAVVGGARRGWASIEMDREGSYTSTLDLDRMGYELMLAVGHSF
ncbi:MAG: hypothetical protein J0M02_12540 [Planctomycetes bacterium]|nr:hypothetical protein [Planctomycetota bacterium]